MTSRIPQAFAAMARPLASLTPYPGNAKRHDLEGIRASLRRRGQYRVAVVQASSGYVIAGNGMLEAARLEGWAELAAMDLDVDDTEARRIVLADNRLQELGGYDTADLVGLLTALPTLEDTGYTSDDLSGLLASLVPTPDRPEDPDETPPLPSVPVTEPGDIWTLGPHRLICGDSTDLGVIRTALNDQKLHAVWTDPPYGIAYKPLRSHRPIANDQDLTTAESVLAAVLANLPLAKNAPVFVCCDWRSLAGTLTALEAATIVPKAAIVWDKGHRVQNLDRYGKQYELIVYAGPYGGQATHSGDVWVFPRDYDPDHPTPKPVSLIEHALDGSTKPGQLVLDPFAGSGSLLVAAHLHGRRAALVELDPRYCDVIVLRWQLLADTLPLRNGSPVDLAATLAAASPT